MDEHYENEGTPHYQTSNRGKQSGMGVDARISMRLHSKDSQNVFSNGTLVSSRLWLSQGLCEEFQQRAFLRGEFVKGVGVAGVSKIQVCQMYRRTRVIASVNVNVGLTLPVEVTTGSFRAVSGSSANHSVTSVSIPNKQGSARRIVANANT